MVVCAHTSRRECADDLAHEADRFKRRSLGLAATALTEDKGDLVNAQAGMADEDLQQDLEAQRSQRFDDERVVAHKEKATHRVR